MINLDVGANLVFLDDVATSLRISDVFIEKFFSLTRDLIDSQFYLSHHLRSVNYTRKNQIIIEAR